jgi:hypothetical protein
VTYTFTVSCPRCRQGLTHRASGAPGLQTWAVAHCGRCKRDWMIVVELRDVSGEVTYRKPSAESEAA